MTALPPKLPYVTREEYDRLPGVNWSTLKVLGQSPAAYRERLLNGGGDSDTLKRGRAIHTATFEFDKYAAEYVVWEDRRAGKAWEAFEAANSHREILTAKMNETAIDISRAVHTSEMAKPYVSGGQPETTIRWHYQSPTLEGFETYGFDGKGRLDNVTSAALVDLKSTKDASPEGFAREVFRYEYHVQAAWYADGFEAATGIRKPFVIVAVEAAAPHVVQVYRVPDELLAIGRERYRDLLARLNVCRRENRWPGYAETELSLTLPRWAQPVSDEENADDLGLVFGE